MVCVEVCEKDTHLEIANERKSPTPGLAVAIKYTYRDHHR